MYSGLSAIDYLTAEISKVDSVSSSHWNKYHSSFRFNGKTFEGIEGFGGFRRPRRTAFFAMERLLQLPFRKMGGSNFFLLDQLMKAITNKQDRNYDLDALRQSLTLSYLYDNANEYFSKTSVGLVIGDGFGTMAALLLASGFAGRVILINLNKTLLVDLWFLKLWLGNQLFNNSVVLVTNLDDLSFILDKPYDNKSISIIALQAKNYELLKNCPIDFAINIASMQEMNPPVIAAYFDVLRSIKRDKKLMFYCCNREIKSLPDGTITQFSKYPWHEDDVILQDGLCPWHQKYYSLKPPFFRKYEGPIRHRLVLIKNS